MECHDCPHAEEIAAGVFADVLWEETPCSGCFAAGRSGAVCLESGKRHVRLDEGRTAAAPVEVREDTLMPVSVLADALASLLRLPGKALEAVRLRYQGMRYREIAARLGMGRSACSMLVVRALADHPVLMELMPRTKGRVRRRVGGRAEGECRRAARRGSSAVTSSGVTRAARGKRT